MPSHESNDAELVELADTRDSSSRALGREGSTPSLGIPRPQSSSSNRVWVVIASYPVRYDTPEQIIAICTTEAKAVEIAARERHWHLDDLPYVLDEAPNTSEGLPTSPLAGPHLRVWTVDIGSPTGHGDTVSYLDPQMRAVLAQLEMISHGTIASYNSAGGGHGENPDPRPKGANGNEHLYWAHRYGPPFGPMSRASAHDDIARLAVINDAREELERLRGHGIDRTHVAGETKDEEEARMLKDGSGFTPEQVARRFNCTPTRIRRVRRQHQYSVEQGTPPPTITALDAKRPDVQRMGDQGYTVRQIENLTKVPRSTIHRWLRAA